MAVYELTCSKAWKMWGLLCYTHVPNTPPAPVTMCQRVKMSKGSFWLALDGFLQHVGFCGSALGDAKFFLLPLFTWITWSEKRIKFRHYQVSLHQLPDSSITESPRSLMRSSVMIIYGERTTKRSKWVWFIFYTKYRFQWFVNKTGVLTSNKRVQLSLCIKWNCWGRKKLKTSRVDIKNTNIYIR